MRRFPSAVMTLALLGGLLWLDLALGPFSFVLRRAGAGTLITCAALLVPWDAGSSRWPRWVAVASGLAILVCPTVALSLSLYVAAVALASAGGGLPAGLGHACLGFLCVRFATELVPHLLQFQEAARVLTDAWVRRWSSRGLVASPAVMGGLPAVLAALYLLARWRFSGWWPRVLAALAIVPAWLALLGPTRALVGDDTGSLMGFGAGTGVAWLLAAVTLDAFLDNVPHREGPSGLAVPVAATAMFATGVALVGWPVPAAKARKIVVLNRGGLDWERPVFGKFGAYSGGMFGLFPVYCRANGFDFGVIDADTIEPETLEGAQVLVLINSPKIWAGDERRAVLDFVDRGGSLLVLGDHTDVFGLMKGFNSLLNEFGIQFRFDSAYHARSNWRGCTIASPDAVASLWDRDDPGVSIGASLALSGWARPLLVGRYAHSDRGIRENVPGSYLGNYHYDKDEIWGDLVLVATASLGRGRVVVWGDTSSFQGALNRTFVPVVGPLLRDLLRPASPTEWPMVRVVVATGLLAAVGIAWTRASAAAVGVITLSLTAGLGAAWAAQSPTIRAPVHLGSDTFLVDNSHLPAVGHYESKVNPTGPLYGSLLRMGYRVEELEGWDPAAIAKSRGIAVVAPLKPFSAAEVTDLLRAEEAGSIVILAVGQPDSAGSRALLRAHELDLAPLPLGTVVSQSPEGRRERDRPRFLDAWPIRLSGGGDPAADPAVEVIYRAGTDIIALFRRQGRGGLLLFADSRFFSTMNVEDLDDHWLGNLALIHDVFRKYLGGDPAAVRPLFRSPVKPQ